MPSISGWALRPARNYDLAIRLGMFLCPRYRAGLCDHLSRTVNDALRALEFLCPRYRAGLCDGRVVEVLLTCGFAGRCADRRVRTARIAPIRAHPRRRVADQGILPRQPRRKTTIRGHGCTG